MLNIQAPIWHFQISLLFLSLNFVISIFRPINSMILRRFNAVLLTMSYTQHALWPYIDSKINNIRHFIKVQLVNKGIKFINLHSILKVNAVISIIPAYLEIGNLLCVFFAMITINIFVVLF